MKPDVVVVGAGPAGSAAATDLAGAGARVLLVERSRFPRDKPCGDGLTSRAIRALASLGVVVPMGPSIRRIVMRRWDDYDVRTDLEIRGAPSTTVCRRDLDECLAMAAVDAGAELADATLAQELCFEHGAVCGVRVRSKRGGIDLIRAPITIIAEGSGGNLTRQVPVSRVPGQCISFAVRHYVAGVAWEQSPAFEFVGPLTYHSGIIVGYAWLFPMRDSVANVGVGHLGSGASYASLTELLERFTQKLLRDDRRFAQARVLGHRSGGPIRIGARASSTQAPGVLLVGDSAGLVDPYWAEGISAALESGRAAAQAAAGVLSGGSELSTYVRSLHLRRIVNERISPSLPTLYKVTRHIAQDLPALPAAGAGIHRVFTAIFDNPPSSISEKGDQSDPLELAVQSATSRALRLAGRDRPFFESVAAQLDADSLLVAPVAAAFYAALSDLSGCPVHSPEHRRGAVCLELMRLATAVLVDLDVSVDANELQTKRPLPRGGGWLAATLGLLIADRLLARSTALAARLADPGRRAVAEAQHEITAALARDEVAVNDPVERARALAAAAARAGALMGGADSQQADFLARAAARLAHLGGEGFLSAWQRSRQTPDKTS